MGSLMEMKSPERKSNGGDRDEVPGEDELMRDLFDEAQGHRG